MSYIDKAIKYAEEAHSGAFRKGTTIPYISHPLEAATIASSLTDNRDVITAAILHDTVEDAGKSFDEIENAFGGSVAMLLAADSEDKREELPAEETWQIRKEESLETLRQINDKRVKQLALADKLSNIRAIYRDYCTGGSEIWNKFNQKDPQKQAWYYSCFLEICFDLSMTMAYKEYEYLLCKIFGRSTICKQLLLDICNREDVAALDFPVVYRYLDGGICLSYKGDDELSLRINAYEPGGMLVLDTVVEIENQDSCSYHHKCIVFNRENTVKVLSMLNMGTVMLGLKSFFKESNMLEFQALCKMDGVTYNTYEFSVSGDSCN